MHVYRSHTCGALRKSDIGASVRLSGWVHRKRDHGGLLFVDLRDHYGLVQLVVEPEAAIFAQVDKVRAESVVRIEGTVVPRAPEAVNPNLATGEIEIRLSTFEVMSAAADLPLPVFGEPDYPEEIRMRYRYLDLRRETMHRNIVLRSKVVSMLRREMDNAGFTEFQTPILTASSPEGARDFLVPSRLHPGKFFALPQAPQIFKQLIMVSGFDRYFQIAPCFRDEDARADRSAGEFYQLDIEMSFVEQSDVHDTTGPVVERTFRAFAGERTVDAYQDWPKISYDDSLRWFGTDKPDLRVPLRMQDVTAHFVDSGFKIFADLATQPGKEIRAIPAPRGGSRAFCDRMNAWAQREGLPGLAYIMFDEADGKGPVAKNIGPERTHALRMALGLSDGDAVFFAAGDPATFGPIAAKARMIIGEELGHMDKARFAFCWIVDFPMYEWDADNKKIEFGHNPFSMPQGGLDALQAAITDADRLRIKANQYDLVCNGYEMASGAIRNHRPDIMYKAFAVAGYGPDVVEQKFGGMLNAFRFGAPPHGGIAYGVDRIVMLLAEQQNIREVTMFPLTQGAEDLLLGAPAEVSAQQLKDIHIRLALPATEKR